MGLEVGGDDDGWIQKAFYAMPYALQRMVRLIKYNLVHLYLSRTSKNIQIGKVHVD